MDEKPDRIVSKFRNRLDKFISGRRDDIVEVTGFSIKQLFVLSILTILVVCMSIAWLNGNNSSSDFSGFSLNFISEFGGALLAFIVLDIIFIRLRATDGNKRIGFDYNRFISNIRTSSEVRIMTTFLNPLNTSGEHKNETLRKKFLDNLEYVLQRSDKKAVTLLFLDPFSFSAYHREEGRSVHVRLHIMENLIVVYDWWDKLDQELKERISVQVFDMLPPFVMLQSKEIISLIYFKRDLPISKSPRFRLPTKTPIANFLIDTFSEVEIDPKTRPIEEYIYIQVSFPNNGLQFRVRFVKDARKFRKNVDEQVSPYKRFYILLNTDLNTKQSRDAIEHSDEINILWRQVNCKCKGKKKHHIISKDFSTIMEKVVEKYGRSIEVNLIYELYIEDFNSNLNTEVGFEKWK